MVPACTEDSHWEGNVIHLGHYCLWCSSDTHKKLSSFVSCVWSVVDIIIQVLSKLASNTRSWVPCLSLEIVLSTSVNLHLMACVCTNYINVGLELCCCFRSSSVGTTSISFDSTGVFGAFNCVFVSFRLCHLSLVQSEEISVERLCLYWRYFELRFEYSLWILDAH